MSKRVVSQTPVVTFTKKEARFPPPWIQSSLDAVVVEAILKAHEEVRNHTKNN